MLLQILWFIWTERHGREKARKRFKWYSTDFRALHIKEEIIYSLFNSRTPQKVSWLPMLSTYNFGDRQLVNKFTSVLFSDFKMCMPSTRHFWLLLRRLIPGPKRRMDESNKPPKARISQFFFYMAHVWVAVGLMNVVFFSCFCFSLFLFLLISFLFLDGITAPVSSYSIEITASRK